MHNHDISVDTVYLIVVLKIFMHMKQYQLAADKQTNKLSLCAIWWHEL